MSFNMVNNVIFSQFVQVQQVWFPQMGLRFLNCLENLFSRSDFHFPLLLYHEILHFLGLATRWSCLTVQLCWFNPVPEFGKQLRLLLRQWNFVKAQQKKKQERNKENTREQPELCWIGWLNYFANRYRSLFCFFCSTNLLKNVIPLIKLLT